MKLLHLTSSFTLLCGLACALPKPAPQPQMFEMLLTDPLIDQFCGGDMFDEEKCMAAMAVSYCRNYGKGEGCDLERVKEFKSEIKTFCLKQGHDDWECALAIESHYCKSHPMACEGR
ncbi:hypothetical protein K402DRAFT_406097 [Aulographum hederae CBS 113979]|uniref:Extracellular membrane protein CFEM domain-containing protein n=1 Tax=Aulographum hederae CBS 113979 TaxID=1176131 RepID=A0A6G1GUG6_9PEZI|nr:hypothetical protein K402DRAFT_406097 [Aulographum hederae CBS 113979]